MNKTNRELLNMVGEICSDAGECENCSVKEKCLEDIMENHEELFEDTK